MIHRLDRITPSDEFVIQRLDRITPSDEFMIHRLDEITPSDRFNNHRDRHDIVRDPRSATDVAMYTRSAIEIGTSDLEAACFAPRKPA